MEERQCRPSIPSWGDAEAVRFVVHGVTLFVHLSRISVGLVHPLVPPRFSYLGGACSAQVKIDVRSAA